MSGNAPADPVAVAVLLAFDRPEEALVRLWLVVQDHRAYQSALTAWKSDAPAFAALTARLIEELHHGEPGTAAHGVSAEYALAAVDAVDTFLAETLTGRGSGTAHAPILVTLGGVEHWVLPRGDSPARGALGDKPNSLHAWMRRHWIVPRRLAPGGFHVDVQETSRSLRRDLEVVACEEVATLAAAAFADGVEPLWIEASPGCGNCVQLSDTGTRVASVTRALDLASERGASVVVFPELTVPPPVLIEIAAWLHRTRDHALRLVVAGSFHEAEGATRRNVGVTLDRNGSPVLRHVKLQPQVLASPDRLPVDTEDVTGGSAIPLLVTPLGLVATPICLDFCELAAPFTDLWHRIGVELALVPSMSGETTMKAHERRAKDLLLTHGTTTLVASQAARPDRDSHAALLLAPGCRLAQLEAEGPVRLLVGSVGTNPVAGTSEPK